MFNTLSNESEHASSLALLDRVALAYLILPLTLFIAGWLNFWLALSLLACVAFASRALFKPLSVGPVRHPLTSSQFTIAVAAGCAWALLGGADHWFFANADWHIRDAVLHDLVVSPWPVGYGLLDGKESLLRAPLAFYLPAALAGKLAGLTTAHVFMGFWTAMGSVLFLAQILSLTPSRLPVMLGVVVLVVMFSGLDIIGSLLNDGPRFRSDWDITTHLEWWAGKYQYSSMTTQLFWVPNHALGGWLTIGLLFRNSNSASLDSIIGIALVALALWSPLTAIGVVPFAVTKILVGSKSARLLGLMRPQIWAAALIVGLVVVDYLVLDAGRIDKGLSVGGGWENRVMDMLQQTQFFLLEAGFIGAAVISIRRCWEVALALVVLALLPIVHLGPGNDLVMRASIPSLVVLLIGACLALFVEDKGQNLRRKKILLTVLLVMGAATPVAEIARAVILPSWPINMTATLIGADCGRFAPHYVARLGNQLAARILRTPHRLNLGPQGTASCDNPAFDLMWHGRVQ